MIARLTAAVAVLALALTGCSSDSDSAGAEPTPSASESPAVQKPTPTNVPAYAQNEGRPGAEQFIDYWVRTLNKATQTGEIKQLVALSAPTCRMCGTYAMGIDEIYDAGGHVESQGWDVQSITHEAGGDDSRRVLVATVDVAPQKVYESKGAKPEKFEGGERMYRFVLSRSGSNWVVEDLAPS